MKANKKDLFIAMVEEALEALESHPSLEFDKEGRFADALAYFEAFKTSVDTKADKPKFTDNGKLILQFMKDNQNNTQNMFKAREIAEGIFISSKSVGGSMRKLVTDGYVEKMGADPIIYALTDAGVEVDISE